MAKYRVTGPEGRVITVNAPDDATPEQVRDYGFSQLAKTMDPQTLSMARVKNDDFADYLRREAMKPREGESDSDRFRRLYGGPDAIPAAEGMARAGYQGLSFGSGDEATATMGASLPPLMRGASRVVNSVREALNRAGDMIGVDAGLSPVSLPGEDMQGDWSTRRDNILASERRKVDQFRKERPITAAASEIAGAIPTALAIPVAGAGTNLPMLTRMLLGMGQGATEGAVYGFNAGEGGLAERGRNAAITGGVGGVAGALAPAAAAGVSNLINNSLWRTAAKQAGMEAPAYRAVTQVTDADRIQPGMIGPDTMLADVSPRSMKVLDTAAQTTGPQARMVEEAVGNRVNQASQRINQALDTTLGQPQGITATETALRQGSAPARSAAYDAAYAAPIDYTTDAGRQIEALVRDRVPMTAINKANAMMRAEGNRSMQIKASVGDDGSITFETMPDVRQIDYITRALNDVAQRENGAGALGGQTQMGRLYQGLSRDLRSLTRQAVPEYATALDTAAGPIQARNAMLVGSDALSARVTRDELAEQVAGMSRAELDFVRQGVRAQIDDTLANVKAAFTDPNMDAREAAKALKDLTTRAAREKMAIILGQREAAQFYQEIDATFPAFAMKAGISTRSPTAPREFVNDAIRSQADDGVINALRSGNPVNATQRLTQALLGRTANDKQRITDETYQQIVQALMRQGPDAQALVNQMQLSAQNIPPRMDQMGRLTRLLMKGLGTGSTAPMVQR